MPRRATMRSKGQQLVTQKIVSAKDLELMGILKRRTALRMAKLGLIPHVRFGEKMRAVGFIPGDLIEALKKGYTDEIASRRGRVSE